MHNSTKSSDFKHNETPVLGILITNLGTPDEATTPALRRYLREFLWDPRIVDMPRVLWWCILQVILFIRPAKSAQAYQKIWDKDSGSPLLSISRKQVAALRIALKDKIKQPFVVELGMRYGNPSVASALANLHAANARRLLVMPLYPQYSATTTASTFDAPVGKYVKKLALLSVGRPPRESGLNTTPDGSTERGSPAVPDAPFSASYLGVDLGRSGGGVL